VLKCVHVSLLAGKEERLMPEIPLAEGESSTVGHNYSRCGNTFDNYHISLSSL